MNEQLLNGELIFRVFLRTITLSKGAVIKGTITRLGEPEGDVFVEVYSNQIIEGSAMSTSYLINGVNYEITGLSSDTEYEIHVTHDSFTDCRISIRDCCQ